MTTRRTRNTKKKRGPVKSKKVTYDGITFASGLERYMYQALKKNKIKSRYEGETFVLLDGFYCLGIINSSNNATIYKH